MQTTQDLTLDDFDFDLPPHLIAQRTLPERTASRLLHVAGDDLRDLAFTDIERLLVPGDLLVFNDTRVVKARLLGHKPTGGRVEALIERVLEPTLAAAMVRTSHRPQPGTVFDLFPLFGEMDLDSPPIRRVRFSLGDPSRFQPVENSRERGAVQLGPGPEFTRCHLRPVKEEAQDHGLCSR